MTMKNILVILWLLCIPFLARSQKTVHNRGDFLDDSLVHRIEITIDPGDFEVINSNPWMDIIKPVDLVITTVGGTDSLTKVGFRIKGNASRNNDKKSYKLSFNEFNKEASYRGYKKISVNAFWNDPTHLRAHLATELFHAMEIPVARCSFADIYINGKYQGLYNLVEQVDEIFLKDRFGTEEGNLYKCYSPADLKFLGEDPREYRKLEEENQKVYELKTNRKEKDFSGLVELISLLNNTPTNQLAEALEKRFDVDSYLKIMAIDVLIGNWDSPLFSASNFYLYDNPETGKFELIPYDFDNTFGIDWVDVDWGKKDIYDWPHHWLKDLTEEDLEKYPQEQRMVMKGFQDFLPGRNDRPLYYRILEVKEYRAKFEQHLRFLVDNYFDTDAFRFLIDQHMALITPSLKKDALDNFSWEQIQMSIDNPLPDVFVDFGNRKQYFLPYGLKEFISVSSDNILKQLDQNLSGNLKPDP